MNSKRKKREHRNLARATHPIGQDGDQYQVMVAAATALMEAHAGVVNAMGTVCATLSGLLAQMRAHERSLEGHDDVIAVMKSDLLAASAAAFQDSVTQAEPLLTRNDCNAMRQAVRNLDSRHHVMQFPAILQKYAKSFVVSKMAPAVLTNAAQRIVDEMSDVGKRMAELFAVAATALEVRAILNAPDELPSDLRRCFSDVSEALAANVEDVFVKAQPRLDQLARAENAAFCRLTAEGLDAEHALDGAIRQFADKVDAVLNGETEDGSPEVVQ